MGNHHTSGEVLFDITDLSKNYRSGELIVQALRGVSLQILSGDLVVLLGPSGSGKSTFLNLIGGLDQASGGRIRFADEPLSDFSESQLTLYRREHIGFVFQDYNLIPSLTALENVALVSELSQQPMAPMAALRQVQLEHRADHFPSQLSGGEKQRVAIARALAKQPEVLMCDEPTGALDSQTGRVVLSALQQVNATLGTTVVIITHNVNIARIAHQVIRFSDGSIASMERNDRPEDAAQIAW